MPLQADDTLDLAPHRWVNLGPDGWRHRPRWKVAVNTVLRLLQRGRARCWLFVSNCVDGPDGPDGRPSCIGYGFAHVEMERPKPTHQIGTVTAGDGGALLDTEV